MESEKVCKDKYNAEVEFAANLDIAHLCIHKDHEKNCDEGSVARKKEHYQEVGTRANFQYRESLMRVLRSREVLVPRQCSRYRIPAMHARSALP